MYINNKLHAYLERPLGGAAHSLLDLRVLGAALEHRGEIHHRHVGRGHPEGHACELAVERGDHLAHGLGGTGGRGDDVHAHGSAAAAPVLFIISMCMCISIS